MNVVDLQIPLESNYARHAKFRFGRPPWQLDTALVSAFDSAYLAMEAFQSSLTRTQSVASRQSCLAMLDAVFDALKGQVSDAHEAGFLEELQGESRRLLAEELDHLHAASTRQFVRFASPAVQDDAMRLATDRHYFGALREPVVKEILALGADEVATLRARAAAGRLTRDDLSFNSGPVIRRIVRVLNREFRSLGVLDAVGAYLGRRASVTGLALELSVPQADWWTNPLEGMARPPRTLYAHLDESISLPKSIVYLSDVDASNGPTSCYRHAYEGLGLRPLQAIVGRILANVGNGKDSPLREYYGRQYHRPMSSERFREHFMRLPAAMRFNSHLGWDVDPDSELERALTECERTMTGRAGTFIVFDGARLLHRGGMVQQSERLALQVIFSDATLRTRVLNKIKRTLT